MIRPAVRVASGLLATAAVAVLVVGCSSGPSRPAAAGVASSGAAPSSSAASSVPSPSAPSPSGGIIRSVTVVVDGRTVLPSPGRVGVKVGEQVRITVISDVANEVHVHGVDVEKELSADKPTSFVVAYDQPGVYEVELHHPALLLFQFVVR